MLFLLFQKDGIKTKNKMLDNFKFFLSELEHKYIYERPSKVLEIN